VKNVKQGSILDRNSDRIPEDSNFHSDFGRKAAGMENWKVQLRFNMATPDDIPSGACKPFTMPSPPNDIISMASNEHLALDHVLHKILSIPTSSTV
jgi:hypothetical protein